MIFGFGSFISMAYYFCNRNTDPSEQIFPFIKDSMYVVEVDNRIHDIKKPDVTAPSNPETGKKNPDNNNIAIVDSTTAKTNSVEIDHTTIVSTNTGSTTTGNLEIGGGGTGTGTTTATVTSGPTELVFVDTPPEFEGGIAALYKFVSKNVRYPEDAVERGKQGTVYVKFVVDEKGKVCNLSLLNNVGYGLDAEALRVVGIIPNFKSPAKVKGQPVKVYYQLPIKFKLN